ncbi:MAG: HEAT repeat domain-containing protein [Bdellovibrio bacteriovorus]
METLAPIAARAPDALLLIGSHCPHCQSVLESLARLVKEGRLGRLTVINIGVAPDAPEARGIRSVPWTRLGPFELSGALSAAELAEWTEIAAGGGGWGRYFAHLIEAGRLDSLVERVRLVPGALGDLLDLFADPRTGLPLRIGISAVIESLSGAAVLRHAVPRIESLTLSDSPQIRADACYFLGLAGDPGAAATLQRLLVDEDPEVRSVAAEALALLGVADADPGREDRP